MLDLPFTVIAVYQVSNLSLLPNLNGSPTVSYLCFVYCRLIFISLQMCSSQKCGWNSSPQLTPEHLQPTASLVKSTVLVSKVDGTGHTYLGGFTRWKHWASSNHACLFPADRYSFQVAIY